MPKIYNITRTSAAKILGVSTRTVDRYVKSGKLSYKKIANKVLLEKTEIATLKQDFDMLHQEPSSEVISFSSDSKRLVTSSSLKIDPKLDKFVMMFREKDQLLEDKNNTIFVLHRKLGELEARLQSMVSLPDYTKEKQDAILEKKKLEQDMKKLKSNLKNVKVKNTLLIGLFITVVLIVFFFYINVQ